MSSPPNEHKPAVAQQPAPDEQPGPVSAQSAATSDHDNHDNVSSQPGAGDNNTPPSNGHATDVNQSQQSQSNSSETSPAVDGGDAAPTNVAQSGTSPTTTPKHKGKGRAPPPSRLALDRVNGELQDDTVEVSPIHTATLLSRASEAEQLHSPDSPTTSLIATLRFQLELVSEQAQQLNAKLVSSISKHADLEDTVFTLTDERQSHTSKIKELELEKARWEESMNTGLLVERTQIRDEMQRLAAGLVEEERRRGSAEERRAQVENEVDDLAATLFDQANTMVATERMSRAEAEARLKESEASLAAAEAAVRDMQLHLQALSAAPSPSLESAPAITVERKLLNSHPPYAEFLMFVRHLRQVRPRKIRVGSIPAPHVTAMLTHGFLSRAVTEDHEPTLRLDTAANLSWLSRRSVSSAVISGDLLIEPVAVTSIGPPESITCSLCGDHIFEPTSADGHRATASRFSLKPFFGSPGAAARTPSQGQTTVYVFRVATGESKDPKPYPICRNGWCLERLRASCAMWHFIRTSILNSVWNSNDGTGDDMRRSISSATSTPRVTSMAHTNSATSRASDSGASIPVDLSSPAPDEDKLTTASNSPALQATIMEKPPLPQRPAQPLARKSGWGLGGLFGRNTPPSTPPPDADRMDLGSVSSYAKTETPETKSGLGAPIELESDSKAESKVNAESEKAEPVEPVKGEATVLTADGEAEIERDSLAKEEKTEPEKVSIIEPIAEPEESQQRATEASSTPEAVETLVESDAEPGVQHSRPMSVSSASEFATPATDHQELPSEGVDEKPDQIAEPAAEKEAAPEAGDNNPVNPEDDGKLHVEITPEDSQDGTPKETGPAEAAEGSNTLESPKRPERSPSRRGTPLPPPLPRRAPARDRVTTPANETTTSDVTASTAEPAAPAAAPLTVSSEPGSPAVVTVSSSGHARTASTGSTLAPPPLPPRRAQGQPRSPSSPAVIGGASHGEAPRVYERTFLTDDSWEARTWRQVVKLKEEMWRARVGVYIEDK